MRIARLVQANHVDDHREERQHEQDVLPRWLVHQVVADRNHDSRHVKCLAADLRQELHRPPPSVRFRRVARPIGPVSVQDVPHVVSCLAPSDPLDEQVRIRKEVDPLFGLRGAGVVGGEHGREVQVVSPRKLSQMRDPESDIPIGPLEGPGRKAVAARCLPRGGFHHLQDASRPRAGKGAGIEERLAARDRPDEVRAHPRRRRLARDPLIVGPRIPHHREPAPPAIATRTARSGSPMQRNCSSRRATGIAASSRLLSRSAHAGRPKRRNIRNPHRPRIDGCRSLRTGDPSPGTRSARRKKGLSLLRLPELRAGIPDAGASSPARARRA